jgi:hypothetical protein
MTNFMWLTSTRCHICGKQGASVEFLRAGLLEGYRRFVDEEGHEWIGPKMEAHP